MFAEKQQSETISFETYLISESVSANKHEWVNGEVHAMVGASENHSVLTFNIARKIGNHLEDAPCKIFIADMKLKTPNGNCRYPDCMVVCEKDNEDPYVKSKPIILVEVLSHSTRKTDEKDKLLEYINIPTLREYVIIEQDFVDITVYRKNNDWHSTHYFLEEDIYFDSIDLTLSVAEIYHRVENQDMIDFLQRQTR